MICPKCHKNKGVKNGTRPIRRRGVNRRIQFYQCKNPACFYQWHE